MAETLEQLRQRAEQVQRDARALDAAGVERALEGVVVSEVLMRRLRQQVEAARAVLQGAPAPAAK